MQGESARLGTNLAAIGVLLAVVAAALTGLGAAWWAWMAYLLWGALWVTAALGMGDTASRKWLARTLSGATYTQSYTTLTRRLLTPLWSRYCDPAPDKTPWRTQFRAALTWRLYDRALLIAVAYPILLLVGQWIVTGSEGRVGSLVVLPELDVWRARAFVFVLILILIASALALTIIASSLRVLRRMAGDLLFRVFSASILAGMVGGLVTGAGTGNVAFYSLLVFAGLFAGLVATVRTVNGSVALSAALASALAFAITGAETFADATVFAGFFAGVVAYTGAIIGIFVVAYSDYLRRPLAGRIFVTCAVSLLGIICVAILDWTNVSFERRTLFLFLAVLPLLNAIFDVISYAATLSLTRRGLQSRLPILYGLADLALACVLFLALGATLVAAIHGLNLLAGVPLLDLPALFDSVTSTPGAYFWLYAMLFSTILPTALHAALSLLGLQGIWPKAPRRRVALWVESADASSLHTFRASFALGVVWTVPLLLLTAIIWAIWALSAPAILWLLSRYLDALIWIATHPIGAM